MIKESGQSWHLGNEYVIIKIGRKRGWICYLIIQTWPFQSSIKERSEDKRVKNLNGERMVLNSNGMYETIDKSGMVYYFTDKELKKMRIRLKEKDAPLFSPDKFY